MELSFQSNHKVKAFSFFVVFFYTVLYLLNNIYNEVISLDYLINSIVIVVSIYFIIILKTNKLFSVVSLFVFSFSLFIFSRIFLHSFGLNTLLVSESFYWGRIDKRALTKALYVVIISFSCVMLGVYSKKKEKEKIGNKKQNFIESKSFLGKLIIIFFILILPGTIYKYYFDLKEILQHGYLALYSREAITRAPFVIRASWYLYTIILPLIFIIKFKRVKTKKLIILLVLLIALLDTLKGSRAALLRPLFFFFWYYNTFYSNKKINIIKLLPYVLLVFFFIIYMVFSRVGLKFEFDGFKSITNILFYQQGISFSIIAFYFQFENQILNPSRFYILTPITSFFQYVFKGDVFGSGRNIQMVKETLNVDYKLLHAINEDIFLQGFGLGGSYIIELYAFMGMFGVVIGSFMIGRWIILFENNIFKKRWLIIFSWYFITHIVFFSRGNYLINIVGISLTFIIYFFLKEFSPRRMTLKR